jgi:succinate-semialdehyde dehydrogenase/glutarate-semialdehyde dehydrogenase
MHSPTNTPWEPLHRTNLELFRERCYVNGGWCEAESGLTLRVTNPATGDAIGTVPQLDVPEIRRAVAAARAALPTWASKTAKDRATILHR